MSKLKLLIKKSEKILQDGCIPKKTAIDLEEDCVKQISTINKNLEKCIEMFNSLVFEISNTVKSECPKNPVISVYSSYMNNVIKKEPIEPISKFIVSVYSNDEYRQYIIQENEKFFMTNNDIVSSGDAEKLLHFRYCWKKLSSESKKYIKEALKMMVNISGEYLIQKDNGNTIMSIICELKTKVN